MSADERAGRPCCMISEILEEAGFDREKARRLKRQVLEGIVLLCQWQLDRMDQRRPPRETRRGRRVQVE